MRPQRIAVITQGIVARCVQFHPRPEGDIRSASCVAGEADASEISLAENVVRVAMHPADQFEAFRTVIDNGATVADVPARFGVSEDIVEKQ